MSDIAALSHALVEVNAPPVPAAHQTAALRGTACGGDPRRRRRRPRRRRGEESSIDAPAGAPGAERRPRSARGRLRKRGSVAEKGEMTLQAPRSFFEYSRGRP